jgi:anhydro-N-acetylmuramic acid kinase
LSPIFHNLIVKQNKLKPPICILNIGGIANITNIFSEDTLDFESHDIGPGNCLIDEWIRKNSKFQYDHDSLFANNGNINEIILEQAQELFANKPIEKKISLDTKDFDVSFARGLSLEDGSATLTYLTASIISENLNSMTIGQINQNVKILLCGGGRKNKILIDTIKKKIKKNLNLELIDKHNIDGDFIESQAFAYLAIRSLLNYPISFPRTTGCKIPISGGDIVKIK